MTISKVPNDITSNMLNFLPTRETAKNLHLVNQSFSHRWGNDGCLDLSETLDNNHLTDDDLLRIIQAYQAKGQKITSLRLRFCQRITDVGLAHLSALTSLTHLDLSYCDQITDAGLAHLTPLRSLTGLGLTFCDRITDAGLAHLTPLSSLMKLHLSGCSQITDAGLPHISALRSLTQLSLNYCKITDAGLPQLSALHSLTDLNLRFCSQITDDGLPHISALRSLTQLSLSGSAQISDTERMSTIIPLAHYLETMNLNPHILGYL
jgi:F-box and leucine-rich repeat protein 14